LSLFNHDLQIFIYGLCGILPQSITEINFATSFVKVFPVPSSGKIKFEIIPPSNFEEYEFVIFNSEFQVIKSSFIVGQKEINLDGDALSSGNYFYSLGNKNQVFQTGKFILTK